MGYVSCRSCDGSGKKWIERKVKEYRIIGGYDWVTKTIDVPCRACGGSGINDRLYSARCERCNAEIIYPRDAQYAPKYCKICKERIKDEKNAKWREKSCTQCHATIKYNVDWDKVPDLCPSCRERAKARRAEESAKWKEKRCKQCGNVIKYRVDWAKIPDFCKPCQDRQKQTISKMAANAAYYETLAKGRSRQLHLANAQTWKESAVQFQDNDCTVKVRAGWSVKYECPTTDCIIYIRGVRDGHYHIVFDENGRELISEWRINH